jgi:hypothetical protein
MLCLRGLYKSAKKHYSDALEHKKDYLALYTNRAVACLKLEDIQTVIDDCTRVLEYCEVYYRKVRLFRTKLSREKLAAKDQQTLVFGL